MFDNVPPPVKTAAKIGAIGVGVGAGVGGAVFIAPPLLGFTSGGVAAGMYASTATSNFMKYIALTSIIVTYQRSLGPLAASAQSAFYGAFVPAGGVFATLQSVGATGATLPAILFGAGAGASYMGAAIFRRGGGRSQAQQTDAKPEEKTGSKDEA